MRHPLSISLWALAVSSCLLWTSPSSASDWNRETTAVFNRPVEIPGQILPAGIYVFKLADIPGERSVVQIWNADQTLLLATLLAWPDYIREGPSENRFVLEEREKGAPALLKAWIYRGNSHVQTFTYPKTRIK